MFKSTFGLKSTFGKYKVNFQNFTQTSKQCRTYVNINKQTNSEWQEAKLFKDLPGPSKYQLLKGFLPGGKYYNKNFIEFNLHLRSQYGNIYVLPGLFGKRDIVFTYNPNDYQQVFRTEGIYPIRRGFDAVEYYRKVLRKDLYKQTVGLVVAQGQNWSTFRSAVNPIMMNPKTVKMYAPKMDIVALKFVECIKNIRNSKTLEVPDNFQEYMKFCVMDAVGLIALDTDLNLLANSRAQSKAKAIIDQIEELLELIVQLDLQPSLWKIIPTPKFKKTIKVLDTINEFTLEYIEQARERLAQKGDNKIESEKSILERLINIDPLIATTMAMDMFLVGVDTTTTSLAACLLCLAANPTKQLIIRQEIKSILPQKDSPLTESNMKSLPYLRACIKESLRLYPVATGNFRTTGQDVVLSGYRIPAFTDVSMPSQLLQKDAKYFEQPEDFLPERWLRSKITELDANFASAIKGNPFVYLPFGFGPRVCVGKRIVDLELEILLCRLLRNFEIQFNHPTDNMFKTNMMNVPAKPLKFKFIDLIN